MLMFSDGTRKHNRYADSAYRLCLLRFFWHIALATTLQHIWGLRCENLLGESGFLLLQAPHTQDILSDVHYYNGPQPFIIVSMHDNGHHYMQKHGALH